MHGWQLARKGAHDTVSDFIMQELGFALNALFFGKTWMTRVDQLDLWKRLAERADGVGCPLPDFNPAAALLEVALR